MATTIEKRTKNDHVTSEHHLQIPAWGSSVRMLKLGRDFKVLCADGGAYPPEGTMAFISRNDSNKTVDMSVGGIGKRVDLINIGDVIEVVVSNDERDLLRGRATASIRLELTEKVWND